MKREIRRQPFVLRGINPPELVTKNKRATGRLAVFVLDPQGQRLRLLAVEKDRKLISKTEVLGTLPDVE